MPVDPEMEPLHWWQRWLTPAKSANPFKEDSEQVSPFIVRSEVGDSTLSKTETPRATSANPFPKEIDDCMRSRTSERTTTSTPLSKPANYLKLRSKARNVFPLGSSTPLVKSKNRFRRESDLCTFDKSTDQAASERKIKKPVKLPDFFDGKQPLKEYLMHFERCSIIEEKAMFLTASLRGDSRKLLNGLTDAECRS